MSMELISREKAIDMVNEHEYSSYVDCMEVSDVLADVPTVKAIPLEKLEQIREHFETIAFFNGTVKADYVLRMLDKAIKEQNE